MIPKSLVSIRTRATICLLPLLLIGSLHAAVDYSGNSPALSATEMYAENGVAASFTITNTGDTEYESVITRFVAVPTAGGPTQLLGWAKNPDNSPRFNDRAVNDINGRPIAPGPGESVNITTFLFAPAGVFGDYDILVQIDPKNIREESDETNNTLVLASSVSLFPLPELTGEPIPNAPLRVLDGGDTFTITTRILNTGGLIDIDPFLVDFYLVPLLSVNDSSGNELFPINEGRFLGRGLTAPFPISQQLTPGHMDFSLTVGLPLDLDLMNYRLGVDLNPEKTVPESRGSRLSLFGPVHGPTETVTVVYVRDRPDYAPLFSETSFSPTTIPAGEFVTFTGRVRNLTSFPGEEPTTIYHSLIALSGSNVPRYLGTTFLLPIAGNGQHTFIANLRVPDNLPAGEYKYSFEVDSANVIVEREERNNTDFGDSGFPPNILTVTPSVLPNLFSFVPGADFAPTTVETGSIISAEIPITNSGNSATGAFDVRFALSSDAVAGDSDDIIINTFTVGAGLAPGASTTIDTVLPLPDSSTLPPGTYRLAWQIDPADAIEESDEADNRGIILSPQLTVELPLGERPDLRPSALRLQTTELAQGEPYEAEVTIANEGLTEADASDMDVYLTTEQTFEAETSIEIANASVTAVPKGSDARVIISGNLPELGKLPTGTYYFAVVADSGAAIEEMDETNNTTVFIGEPLTVRPVEEGEWPELRFRSYGVTRNVEPGSTFNHLVNIENIGATAAAGVAIGVVLSPDLVFGNDDDIPLPTIAAGTVQAGEISTLIGDTRLPNREQTPDGSYFIYFTLDPDDLVPEPDNTDRVAARIEIRSKPVTLTLHNTDPNNLLISLEPTDVDSAYTIQYSHDLNKWVETGASLAGDPDGPIFFELPPIDFPQAVDALYLRAIITRR